MSTEHALRQALVRCFDSMYDEMRDTHKSDAAFAAARAALSLPPTEVRKEYQVKGSDGFAWSVPFLDRKFSQQRISYLSSAYANEGLTFSVESRTAAGPWESDVKP